MKKDFDKWNTLKKHLDASKPIYVHEREIWFCSFGVNIGSEQDGKHELFERPVLVVKRVTSNTFLGVPLTSNKKQGSWYAEIGSTGTSAIISQIKLFDTRRLARKVTTINETEFKIVHQKIKDFI